MTDKQEKTTEEKKESRWRRFGRSLALTVTVFSLAAVLIALPYVLKSDKMMPRIAYNESYAQTAPAPSACPYWVPCCGCIISGFTAISTAAVDLAHDMITQAVQSFLESFIDDQIHRLVGDMLTNAEEMEQNMMQWWDEWYHNDMRPAMTDMMAQLHTMQIDQARHMNSYIDGAGMNRVLGAVNENASEDVRTFRPSDHVCMAMTQAGGLGRMNVISRAVRWGMEDEKITTGLNQAGSVSAQGVNKLVEDRWNRVATHLCNQDLQNGNVFGADCAAVDADIRPTETLLEDLTLEMRTPATQIATEQLLENIAGVEMTPAVSQTAAESAVGQNAILMTRARVAKRAAARSTGMLSMGWRAEGSGMRDWVQEFSARTGASIPVSDNPSYREIMNAITRYKASSGGYGAELTEQPINIERERYISSSIYLMHLRDYFEMLERVALTLAVDTSIQLDEYSKTTDGRKSAPN